MRDRSCHIRIALDRLAGIRKRTLPETVDIQRHLKAFIPKAAGVSGNSRSLHEDDLFYVLLVIVTVGLLEDIVHESGHLLERHVCLNVIACRIHDVEQRVDVTRTHDLAENGVNYFLLVFLAGKVTGRKQMTFPGKGKRLLTVEQNILAGRNPDRIGAALAVGILSDKFDRAVYDDSAERIDHFDNTLEVGIHVIVDFNPGKILDCRNQTVAADRMRCVQLGGIASVTGDRNIGVTRKAGHRDFHTDGIDTAENHCVRKSVRAADKQNGERILCQILVGTGRILDRDLFLKVQDRCRIRKEPFHAGFIAEHVLIIGRQHRTVDLFVEQRKDQRGIILEFLIGYRDVFRIDP